MTKTPGTTVDSYEAFFATDTPVVWKTRIEGEDFWHARHPGECTPTAPSGLLLGPRPHGAGHVVEENPDGTITVRPNPPSDPQNSNSILCPFCAWHGYIYNGVWTTTD